MKFDKQNPTKETSQSCFSFDREDDFKLVRWGLD